MNSSFHPWLAELRELARARLRRAWRQRWETLFHGLAWIALIAVLAWGWSHVDGDHAGVTIHLLLAQPLVPVALAAILGWGTANGVGRALASEWQDGWWSAMPVAERASARTLRLVAALGALLMFLAVAAALGALAAVADHWRTWLGPMLACVAIGMPLGALAALLRSPKAFAAESRQPRARAVDKPLFPLPQLELARLPHLAAWQRREALRIWRHGGRWWPFVGLGLLVPLGTVGWSLAGLLLFGLSLIWYALALRAAQDTMAQTDALLRALPLRFGDFCRATIAYPLWAWAMTALWGGLGLVFQDAKPLAVALFALALLLGLGLQMVLAWRHRRAPWRARLRLGVDAAIVLVLAYFVGPFALLVYFALLFLHFRAARQIP